MRQASGWRARPVSPAQGQFLRRLMGAAAATAYLTTQPTQGEASARIDQLLAQQRAIQVQVDHPEVEPGYYQIGDNVYVVVLSRTGRPYAKRLTYHISDDGKWLARWEYVPGAVYGLQGLIPLTLDEAKRLGHLHGICVICAKRLTVPKSVEAGIGPVCAKRLLGHVRVAA